MGSDGVVGRQGGAVDTIETHAFSERGEDPGGQVTVVHHDGAAAAGCSVLYPVGVSKVACQTADAAGCVRLPHPPVDDWVVVQSGLALHACVPADTIRIPLEAELSGRIEMLDGTPVPDEFELTISTNRKSQAQAIADAHVPEAYRPALLASLATRELLKVEKGRFAAHGLPQAWQGRVLIPGAYRLIEPENEGPPGSRSSFSLRAPATGIVIRVSTTPLVTGVVTMGGDPLQSGRVRATVSVRSAIQRFEVDLGREGRFAIPLRDLPVRHLMIEVEHVTGTQLKVLQVPGMIGEDRDLGVIEIPSRESLSLTVISDVDGQPIAGAVAAGSDAAGAPLISTRSDKSGVVTLLRPLDEACELEVAALGWVPEVVNVPSGVRQGPIVDLHPANRLIVHAAGKPDGPKRRLVLRSLEGLFETPKADQGRANLDALRRGAYAGWIPPKTAVLTGGANWESVSERSGLAEVVLRMDGDSVVLTGLQSAPFVLRLLDEAGVTIAEKPQTAMGPYEEREVRFE